MNLCNHGQTTDGTCGIPGCANYRGNLRQHFLPNVPQILPLSEDQLEAMKDAIDAARQDGRLEGLREALRLVSDPAIDGDADFAAKKLQRLIDKEEQK